MPTISETRVANMALSHVGSRANIESLIDEVSTEASICRLWFDFSRTQTLEASDWNFARSRTTLTVHGDAVPDGVWAFRYVYPDNCVVARKIENPNSTSSSTSGVWIRNFSTPEARGDAIPFEVETNLDGTEKTILTNLSEAKLVFTMEQKAINLWSPFSIEMLSLALGSHIAFTLTGKTKLSENLGLRFQNMSLLATASNANEMVERPPRDADYIRGRI